MTLTLGPSRIGWPKPLARAPDGGVVVNADAFTTAHRQQIMALAIRHRLPAIYPFRYTATDNGLISYGSDRVDSYRQAASYVDRILRGDPTRPKPTCDRVSSCSFHIVRAQSLLGPFDGVPFRRR
jgi:hypothetical protein